MGASLAKLLRKDVFDAVNPDCYVVWGQAGDFRDGCGVHVFQVGDDDLAIEGLEAVNQGEQAPAIDGLIGGQVRGGVVREGFQVFQADEGGPGAALAEDVRDGYVVGDAMGPGPEGTAGFVLLQAPPELEVDLLGEVAALVGVGFVGGGDAGQGWAVLLGGFLVEGVLIGVRG
jgi:hypothetical protein